MSIVTITYNQLATPRTARIYRQRVFSSPSREETLSQVISELSSNHPLSWHWAKWNEAHMPFNSLLLSLLGKLIFRNPLWHNELQTRHPSEKCLNPSKKCLFPSEKCLADESIQEDHQGLFRGGLILSYRWRVKSSSFLCGAG